MLECSSESALSYSPEAGVSRNYGNVDQPPTSHQDGEDCSARPERDCVAPPCAMLPLAGHEGSGRTIWVSAHRAHGLRDRPQHQLSSLADADASHLEATGRSTSALLITV